MSWYSALAIYFVMWWIALFLVLPFRVRTQQEAGEVVPGSTGSAPARPMLLWRFFWTSVVAAVMFAGFFALYKSGVTWDSIPFLPSFEELSVG